ncbi:hypothetical protein ACH9L7_07045 [Haloferax sp. S1W]|uniref:hypothetical protein n=1 Tax=Haloferax sp. S1W TaxID=3377110 RepID=UPI0037C52A7D
MTDPAINRRSVLKTLGAGAAGGIAFTGAVSGSPKNNFGYVEDSTLEGATVTLSGPPSRAKVFCDAGGSESRIKTEVWEVDGFDDPLYLIPSGYNEGDMVEVGSVFTSCTRNDDIKGEVSVTKV